MVGGGRRIINRTRVDDGRLHASGRVRSRHRLEPRRDLRGAPTALELATGSDHPDRIPAPAPSPSDGSAHSPGKADLNDWAGLNEVKEAG